MHRSAAVAAALAGLIIPATAVASAKEPADPTHNGRGFVRSERTISRSSVGGLTRHWAADLAAKGPGTALIGADRVLVPGTPSSPGLQALDLSTGKELWSWHAEVDDAGAPVRSQSRVIAAGSGSVTALDSATGKPEWTRAVDGGSTTSVAAAFNRVFVSTDRSLTTLKAESGAVRWTAKVDAPQRMNVTYGWLFTTQDGIVAARRPWDGATRWKSGLPDGKNVPSTPYISKFTVFVTAPDGDGGLALRALDSRKGEPLWDARLGGASCASTCQLATPVADDHSVYAATPDGRLTAVERTSGKERWVAKLGSAAVGDPVVTAGGVVLVATEKGRLLAISTQTGGVLWEGDLGAEPESGPVAGAGSVVVRLRDGRTATYALGVTEQRVLDWVAVRAPDLIDISRDGAVAMTRGSGERRVLSRNVDVEDATVSVDATLLNRQWGYGVFVRSSVDDKGRISGYSFQYDPGYNFKFIVRHWEGDVEYSVPFAVASPPDGFDWGARHIVAVTVVGDSLSATVDGRTVLEVPDVPAAIRKAEGRPFAIPKGGRVGLRAWLSGSVLFHGVTVQPR